MSTYSLTHILTHLRTVPLHTLPLTRLLLTHSRSLIHSLIYPLTHSITTYSLTLTLSPAHSFTPSLARFQLTHSYSFTLWLTHSLTHPVTRSPIGTVHNVRWAKTNRIVQECEDMLQIASADYSLRMFYVQTILLFYKEKPKAEW